MSDPDDRPAAGNGDKPSNGPDGAGSTGGNGEPQDSGGNGVRIEKLLEAVNGASAAARNGWLGYLALMAYLVVTLSGITHKELLLNTPTTLPLINVGIPLTGFFAFAPAALLAVHFGLLVQHRMLFDKIAQFNRRLSEDGAADVLRQRDVYDEVHSYFFTQALLEKRASPLLAMALHLMIVATFILAPVLIFFYFQAKFLPYHSEATTWMHRIYLLVDVGILLSIGRYLRDVRGPVRAPFIIGVLQPTLHYSRRAIADGWTGAAALVARALPKALSPETLSSAWLGRRMWANPPRSEGGPPFRRYKPVFRLTRYSDVVISLVVLVSIFVASVPYGLVDRIMTSDLYWDWTETAPIYCNRIVQKQPRTRDVFAPTAWLFVRPVIDEENSKQKDTTLSCQIANWLGGSRNLQFSDKDLDVRKGEAIGTPPVRDFRNADFSRSDLKQVDFRKADLRNALLDSTTLHGAQIREADLRDADLRNAKLQGADLRHANLTAAKLQRAKLRGASLQDAILSRAGLQRADLRHARLENAKLRGARLRGANLQGANLRGAKLQGARLQGADLRGAELQGANPPESQFTASQTDVRGPARRQPPVCGFATRRHSAGQAEWRQSQVR